MVTPEKQNHSEQQPKDPIKGNSSIIENTDKIVEEKHHSSNSAEDDKTKCNGPQPFIVKIDKSQKWTREQIISIVGIIISASLFSITLLTFRQTRRAVSQNTKALNMSYSKDSTLIELSKIDFRPLIQIADPQIENIGNRKETIFSFNLTNIGRLPAKILTGRTMLTFENGTRSKAEIERRQLGPEIGYNTAISNFTFMPQSAIGVVVDDSLYKLYKAGTGFLYFFGEYIYVSYITNKKFRFSFIYQIGAIPRFNVFAVKNEDEPL